MVATLFLERSTPEVHCFVVKHVVPLLRTWRRVTCERPRKLSLEKPPRGKAASAAQDVALSGVPGGRPRGVPRRAAGVWERKNELMCLKAGGLLAPCIIWIRQTLSAACKTWDSLEEPAGKNPLWYLAEIWTLRTVRMEIACARVSGLSESGPGCCDAFERLEVQTCGPGQRWLL